MHLTGPTATIDASGWLDIAATFETEHAMANARNRSTLARHGQLRSPGPIRHLMGVAGVVLSVILASTVGVGVFVVADLQADVVADAVVLDSTGSVPPDIGGYEGGFDLLLTGIDVCEPEIAHLFPGRCDGPDAQGRLNDVNLLVHVSDEPRRITAVSFPRDLMMPIPECIDSSGNTISVMSKQPLNSTYTYGGLNCVAKSISALTGQDIEFAASVTFGGVIKITDAIGGVEVCLATPIRDAQTQLDMAAGTHTISGLAALQFLRTRYGVGDGSDLGRIGNQQQYMSSLARKMLSSEVLGDLPTLLRLADTALRNLEASTTLTNPITVAQIALAVKDVPFADVVFVQYPTLTDPENPNRVVPDLVTAQTIWDAINANQPLQITRQNTGTDGVVTQGPATPSPDPGSTASPTPPDSTVALPESVRGTSANERTCSNGNVR